MKALRSFLTGACLVMAGLQPNLASDATNLSVTVGPRAGEALLFWSGDSSLYEVFQAVDPSMVVDPSNKIAETGGSEWIDGSTSVAPIIYYVITPACAPDCGPGQQCCNGSCVDLSSNPLHCGSCSSLCDISQSCSLGTCGCAAAETDCGGVCVDTDSDPTNCGACGGRCGTGEICSRGSCQCPFGTTSCGGVCVDTDSDPQECGICGNVCTNGETCIGGACQCLPGQTPCNSVCVDTNSDPDNCGACGNVCSDPTSSCVSTGVGGSAFCDCPPHFTGSQCAICIVNHTGADCHQCVAGFHLRQVRSGAGWDVDQGGDPDDDTGDPAVPAGEPINWGNYECLPDQSCSGIGCSGHGLCELVDGEAVCACDPGHVRADCSECAPGYELDSASGACVLGQLCADRLCSGNGQCARVAGELVCVCDPGISGDRCEGCAAGHFDDGSGCIPNAVCDPTTCSGNGTCEDSTGNAVCTCDSGFFGPACSQSCTGVNCGLNGTCQNVDGVAACVCEREGFDAATGCSACKTGYTPVGSGSSPTECVQDTSCLAGSCSSHGTCVMQTDPTGSPLPNLCLCDSGHDGATCFDCAAGFQKAGADCLPLPPPAHIRITGADQSLTYGDRRVVSAVPHGVGQFDVHINWSIESGPGVLIPQGNNVVLYVAPLAPLGVGDTAQMVTLRATPACCPAKGHRTSIWLTDDTDLPMTGFTLPLLAPLDTVMRDFMKYRCVGAGILAVSRYGKLLYARGFGRMNGRGWGQLPAACAAAHQGDPDVEDPLLPAPAVPPTAPMRIGSISKSLTSAMAREALHKRLVALGELQVLPNGKLKVTNDPNKDVNDYVEEKLLTDLTLQALPDDLLRFYNVNHPQHQPPPVPVDLIPDTDPRFNDIQFGHMLGHTSGIPPKQAKWEDFIVPNLQLLRDTGSGTDLQFWMSEEGSLISPPVNPTLEDLKMGIEGLLPGGMLQPGQQIFFFPTYPTATGVSPGHERHLVLAGKSLLSDPGSVYKYSNQGMTLLSAVAAHLWPGGTGLVAGRSGQPAAHVGSALDLFLEEFLGIQGNDGIADGIFQLVNTEGIPNPSPVPRNWATTSSVTYYRQDWDDKRPYCVFTPSGGGGAGTCDTGPWLDTNQSDHLSFPWEFQKVHFAFDSSGANDPGAGSFTASGPQFVKFMREFLVGWDNPNKPAPPPKGAAPSIGERRHGKWTFNNNHNGFFSGTYAWAVEFAAKRQMDGNAFVACTQSSDCDTNMGAVCRDGECVLPNKLRLPPIDGQDRITDAFGNVTKQPFLMPDGVDFIVAVNQLSDPKCRIASGYGCGSAYARLKDFILYGISQMDWDAVDDYLEQLDP